MSVYVYSKMAASTNGRMYFPRKGIFLKETQKRRMTCLQPQVCKSIYHIIKIWLYFFPTAVRQAMAVQYQRLFYGLLSLFTTTKGPEQFKSNKNTSKSVIYLYTLQSKSRILIHGWTIRPIYLALCSTSSSSTNYLWSSVGDTLNRYDIGILMLFILSSLKNI